MNYWKTFIHTALAAADDDRGALTLFGQPGEHELFARHIAESGRWTDAQAIGRTVREWRPKLSKPDNHWFDCLVGCAVAASMAGVKAAGEGTAGRQRKRYTQADFTRR